MRAPIPPQPAELLVALCLAIFGAGNGYCVDGKPYVPVQPNPERLLLKNQFATSRYYSYYSLSVGSRCVSGAPRIESEAIQFSLQFSRVTTKRLGTLFGLRLGTGDVFGLGGVRAIANIGTLDTLVRSDRFPIGVDAGVTYGITGNLYLVVGGGVTYREDYEVWRDSNSGKTYAVRYEDNYDFRPETVVGLGFRHGGATLTLALNPAPLGASVYLGRALPRR